MAERRVEPCLALPPRAARPPFPASLFCRLGARKQDLAGEAVSELGIRVNRLEQRLAHERVTGALYRHFSSGLPFSEKDSRLVIIRWQQDFHVVFHSVQASEMGRSPSPLPVADLWGHRRNQTKAEPQ